MPHLSWRHDAALPTFQPVKLEAESRWLRLSAACQRRSTQQDSQLVTLEVRRFISFTRAGGARSKSTSSTRAPQEMEEGSLRRRQARNKRRGPFPSTPPTSARRDVGFLYQFCQKLVRE